ncbi:MAG: hypothetical protein JSV04_11020 [Candidatus Heimdallarchaeota archaeon]|nr:MAG: hypothetical protein JSV04_11020 [Candidatus Heimdallarchaeota archaeon]
MASIESITAGKLLQEFIKGYDDEPFGEQGLVIVKQLLDLAFPNQSLENILSSKELLKLLTDAAAQSNFRKQPFFLAFMSFLLEKTPQKLQKMDGTQLKNELVALFAAERPIPTLEIERAVYDLSGNPESASLARKMLEGALISTTASLLGYLLVEDENCAGKFFQDLNSNYRLIASHIRRINPLIIFLREFLQFKWQRVSIPGILPTIEELKTNNVSLFVDEHPHDYLDKIQTKFFERLNAKFQVPLLTLIDNCKVQAENKKLNFNLELELEFPQFEKIEKRVIQELEKLQSRVHAGKYVPPKDFEDITTDFIKRYEKISREISKEFMNFQKKVSGYLFSKPPWFNYIQNESQWELKPSQVVLDELNEKLSMISAFKSRKSKTLQKTIAVFEELGGINFAMENIIAHHIYERVSPKLTKLLETPIKHQKVKEFKFLQEMNYKEGLETVRAFLVSHSETIISNLLKTGITSLEEVYIKENPVVLIDEEKLGHPRFLNLLDIPKDLFDENPPESYFGGADFVFELHENTFKMGFHLKTLQGKGNDLCSLLVSSTALQNAQIYNHATNILGNFSGYVYSTAIGNMQVCPDALKAVDDLFM